MTRENPARKKKCGGNWKGVTEEVGKGIILPNGGLLVYLRKQRLNGGREDWESKRGRGEKRFGEMGTAIIREISRAVGGGEETFE